MIESPCIGICVVDPQTRHCTGCGRSLTEIARWASLSSAERRRIMAVLPRRLEALSAPASNQVNSETPPGPGEI